MHSWKKSRTSMTWILLVWIPPGTFVWHSTLSNSLTHNFSYYSPVYVLILLESRSDPHPSPNIQVVPIWLHRRYPKRLCWRQEPEWSIWSLSCAMHRTLQDLDHKAIRITPSRQEPLHCECTDVELQWVGSAAVVFYFDDSQSCHKSCTAGFLLWVSQIDASAQGVFKVS